MNQKTLVVLGAVAILVVAAGALLLFRGKDAGEVAPAPAADTISPSATQGVPEGSEVTGTPSPAGAAPISAGDDAESLFSELVAEANKDEALVVDPASDAAAVRSDSAALSGLGTSYDDTAF